jgi:hypothetical protein
LEVRRVDGNAAKGDDMREPLAIAASKKTAAYPTGFRRLAEKEPFGRGRDDAARA